MENLVRGKQSVECWDDDDDLQGFDNLHIRNVSSTTIGSLQTPHHRESLSSRVSVRSDRESNGGDDDWQVLLPTDDEKSALNAIASVKEAGIPIPSNVPSSALIGGTIKRLGGRRLKKVIGDDWGEDLEMPNTAKGPLQLRHKDHMEFPASLRQFSAEMSVPASPIKNQSGPSLETSPFAPLPKHTQPISSLDQFRDADDDDFFGDVPTIRHTKLRPPIKEVQKQNSSQKTKVEENMEDDLELPADGELKLSKRRDVPRTPAPQALDDIDLEWAEGSLGTRFGGTQRSTGRSNPSSISAFSPSASSCLTGASEDEGLECLLLPEGPFKFGEVLKKRLDNVSPDFFDDSPEKPSQPEKPVKEDFFNDLDIGDGEVFESSKVKLNRNVKHTTVRQTSPTRRTGTTFTFTNKSQPGITRIPKPQGQDRMKTKLESVSETGGPIPKYQRSQSRLGHSASSSISAIPTPSTPSKHHAMGPHEAPSTPSRRGLGVKPSRDGLRVDSSSNPANYLKAKRSMPAMTSTPHQASPARLGNQRPPSRMDVSARLGAARPKTPGDRPNVESNLASARRPPVPFLPAGTSQAQSHHVSAKSSRNFQRPGSSDSNENLPLNRPISRLAHGHNRPTTPTGRRDVAPEALAREAAAKRTITKPTRRRAFGDGSELEIFDDLPTSTSAESKFMRQPVARGAPKSVQLRSKLGLSHLNSSSSTLDSQVTSPVPPTSPIKHDNVPRFARDTNASRLAREQRIGSVGAALHGNTTLPTVRENGPLAPISNNLKGPIPPRLHPSPIVSRSKRGKGPPKKPHLIKPLGEGVNSPRTLKGMKWNPTLYSWEGNENALAPFDVPPPPHSPIAANKGKAAPALIANVGATKGVQMVNGMVFDPQRMCWLKMGTDHMVRRQSDVSSNPMSPDPNEDEDDPFAGLDDLDDTKERLSLAGVGHDPITGGSKAFIDDDWIVGEEFDVGPAFVQRQRVEEEKWRRKLEGWVGEGANRPPAGEDRWKWAIRDALMTLNDGATTGMS